MSRFIDRLNSLRIKRIPILVWIAGALVILGGLFALGARAASAPGFFDRYHAMHKSVVTLAESDHAGLRCGACHQGASGLGWDARLAAEYYRGVVKRPKDLAFIKLAKPTNEACLACHIRELSNDSARTRKVPHPAHLTVASETRECVSCHRWVAHEETYKDKHKKMPFSRVCASFGCHVGFQAQDDCGNCHHILQDAKGPWKEIHPQTVRAHGANACLETCHEPAQCVECHTTGKRPKIDGTFVQASVAVVERQHVKKDWLTKHGSWALKDQNKCLTCHVSTGECQDCHSHRPAFHGAKATWLHKHKLLAKGHETRCLTCHKKPWCDDCHKQFKEMQ